MTTHRVRLVVVVAIVLAASPLAAESIPARTSLDDFVLRVEALGARVPQLAAQVTKARDSVAVVFVPGILGTQLKRKGTVIWGDGSPDARALALPPSGTDPDVEVKTLRHFPLFYKLRRVDVYGEFSRDADQARNGRGIYREFPYDWRRDIRKSAEDLDRFLKGADFKDRSIVIIAHSMGGLVTWYWQNVHYRGVDDERRVQRLLLLGSPLGGSCEVVRMLVDGYRDIREAGAGSNLVYKYLFGDLRPAALTFPSVFQLLPPVPLDPDEVDKSCLEVPLGLDADSTIAANYFSVEFWRTSFGRWLLTRKGEPWNALGGGEEAFFTRLKPVVDAAAEFRRTLNLQDLKIPTTFFYSQRHETTGKATTIKSGDSSEITFPFGDPGDGRVPVPSAKNGQLAPDSERTYKLLDFTHGDLPKDGIFIKYLANQVRRLVLANVVVANARLLLERDDLLRLYVTGGGREISATVVAADVGRRVESDVQELVIKLNKRISAQRGGVVAYVQLRATQRTIAATDPAKNRALVPALEIAASDHANDDLKLPFVNGRLGWALVANQQYKAAIGPLTAAYTAIPAIPVKHERTPDVVDFKRNTPANLGIALFNLGRCAEAKTLLAEASLLGSASAAGYLKRACTDQETGRPVPLDQLIGAPLKLASR